MKQESELKLQAYLDGELSPADAREIERLLAEDVQARDLRQELTTTRDFLKTNELPRTVADTREFYWSQIQRRIEAGEKSEAAAARSTGFNWRRALLPFAAVAAVTLIAVSAKFGAPDQNTWLAEVENLADETTSVSFRSKSENMFVVWVYNKADETLPVSEAIFEESLIQ